MKFMGQIPVVAWSFHRVGIRSSLRLLAAIVFLGSWLLDAQSGTEPRRMAPGPDRTAIVKGYVRDENARSVPFAAISLQDHAGVQVLQGQTAVDGSYKLTAVAGGTYTLGAESGGFRSAKFGPFVIDAGQEETIDLTLSPASGKTPTEPSQPDQPQYDDEPKFTVAGVSAAASPGGHGSDAILRTTETLSQQTASLGERTPANSFSGNNSNSADTGEESRLRGAVEQRPEDFIANHRLGTFLAENGKSTQALPYLERASRATPDDFDNAYELARAEANLGENELALTHARACLAQANSSARQAALHHLLGNVEEKLGRPLEAVQDYQRAAELDPSETHLFDWGSELLVHRALEPAAEVFTRGKHLFPHSSRMLIGLGVANYARGFKDEGARGLCEAADLNPGDPRPYLFMGRLETVENAHSGCLAEKLQQFARLQPDNGLANYYSALTIDRFGDGSEGVRNRARVQALLEKAVELSPSLGAAYLQLGILYSDQKNFPQAIPAYQKAIQSSPDLAEAHFRLSHAYSIAGEKTKAAAELELYRQASSQAAEQAERERREIHQFVFTLRDQSPATPPRAQQP
jgi:tetratricopeptide (TPR) repeat protein